MYGSPFPRAIAGGLIALALAFLPAAPAVAHNTPQEAANKKLVLDFYAALEKARTDGMMAQRIGSIAEQYIAPDYIQHREGSQNGRDAFVQLMQGARPRMAPAKLEVIMAQGDRVVQITSRGPSMIWNMFRIKGGKLAEHWDAMPSLSPPPNR